MGGYIQVTNHIFSFKLHIHRPTIEICLPFDFTGDDALFRCAPRFVASAGFKIGLIFKHHLLAADFDPFATLGRIFGEGGVGIRNGHARRGRGGLGRGETDVGEGGDGFAVGGLAGNFPPVGENVVGHWVSLPFPYFP